MRNGTRVFIKTKTFPERMYGTFYSDGKDTIVSTPVNAVRNPEEVTPAPTVKKQAFTEKNIVAITYPSGQCSFIEVLSKGSDVEIPGAMFRAAKEWNELLEKSNLPGKEGRMIRRACDFAEIVIPNEICAKYDFIFADSEFDMTFWEMSFSDIEDDV